MKKAGEAVSKEYSKPLGVAGRATALWTHQDNSAGTCSAKYAT